MLRVNAVGRGLVPLWLPLNPIEVEPPGASVPFQDRLVAVTWLPLWVQVADQPWLTFWLPGKAKPSDQPLHAADPVLASVTVPVKPPPQSLTL